MKNLLFACLLLTVLSSCKQEKETPAKNENSKKFSGSVPSRSCYRYAMNGDTFLLKLTIADAKVMGRLTYNFAQKDDNMGSLEGTYSNKMVVADYTFTSEGQSSVREVAFQLVNNRFMEGFGEMEELNGKMVFKDKNAIKFDGQVAYQPIPCY